MFRTTTTACTLPRAPARLILSTLLLCLFAIGGFAAPAGEEIVAGPQFQVSGTATGYGYEMQPSVATDADGNFVVVWSGYGEPIWGRLFAADGTPDGNQFQVNTDAGAYYAGEPSVAADSDGDFVVVWRDYQNPGPPVGWLVRGRRFAADGTPGDQFRVSSRATGYAYEWEPSVSADADGDFVVVWRDSLEDDGSGTPYGYLIQGRRFTSGGAPAADQFQVGSATTGYALESEPSVATDTEGNFVVVWRDLYAPGLPYGPTIEGRRFAADGTPRDDQFQVGSTTTEYVYEGEPSVAMDADGDFVVVWSDIYRPLQGRLFAADGTPRGDQFQVASTAAEYGFQDQPSASADPEGDFVVVWRDYVDYGPDFGARIQGRVFTADGTLDGPEFQVSTTASEYAYLQEPSVVLNSDGNFVVAWSEFQYPGPPYGFLIQGRQFAVGAPAVEVEIDIKPGSDRNPINPYARGLLPVAILGSDSFDVANIDVTTLAFGPSKTEPAHDLTQPDVWADHTRDANGDGFVDLITHYRTREVGLALGDTQACLGGKLTDGTPFEGCASVDLSVVRGARRAARTH